mgnify:CR=1 FL=1
MSKIRNLIQTPAAKQQFEAAIPKQMAKYLTPDRQIRIILNALNRNSALEKCTQESLLEVCMKCTEFGLEPNGEDAHLIPYGNKATLVIDYKGWVKIAYRSGKVLSITANVVRENDLFDYNTCDYVPFEFRRDSEKPKTDDAGKVMGAFCVILMKDGIQHREVMTESDIQKIRQRSKAANKGPWVTDTDEMRKKTVFKRARKWIPLEANLADAIKYDNEQEFDKLPESETVPPAVEKAEDIMDRLPLIESGEVDK